MMKKLLSLALAFSFALSFSGGLLFADDDEEKEVNPVEQPTIPVPDFLPAPDVGTEGGETQDYILNETVPRAINIGIGLLSITAFIGILIAAIQMLTAYGNDEKTTRAKTNLRYSLIGLLLVMLAYAIVSIVVSVALPNEEDAESWLIPTAYAVDDEDIGILLPSQQELIEEQDDKGRVALPGGDFLGEIVPAVITNIMYVVGFLIFIAFMYGGILLVIGRGNEEALTKAKNIMIYAAIAVALVSLGFALVYGITSLSLTKDEDSTSDDVFVDTEERNE